MDKLKKIKKYETEVEEMLKELKKKDDRKER